MELLGRLWDHFVGPAAGVSVFVATGTRTLHEWSETESEDEDGQHACQADQIAWQALSREPCKDLSLNLRTAVLPADLQVSHRAELDQEDGVTYARLTVGRRKCAVEGCLA